MINIDNNLPGGYEPVSQTLILPCATNLNVLRWSRSQINKPSCLLLHGLDNNAHVWDSLAHRLSHYFTVYALDFRGHGESSWADASTYNTQKLVEDIENVRLHLNLKTFYLIGHSLGGRVATYYTALYPAFVIALVLCDVGSEVNDIVSKKMREDSAASPVYFNCRESYYQYLKQLYVIADEYALQHFAKHSLRCEGERYYNKTDQQCRDVILNSTRRGVAIDNCNYHCISEALPDIKQPTLLVKGEYSAVLSLFAAKRMLECLSNGRLVSIDSAGHAIMLDNPSETIGAIEDFLLGVSGFDRLPEMLDEAVT